MPVTIVQLDYDFWYELDRADRHLEADDRPSLNLDGVLYYVCFRSSPAAHPGWVDSPGFATIARARLWALTKVPSAIDWLPPEQL